MSGKSNNRNSNIKKLALETLSNDHDGTVAGNDRDIREQQLFRSLDLDNDQQVYHHDLLQALEQSGLKANDARLRESMAAFENLVKTEQEKLQPAISETSFCETIRPNILLIERALRGQMVIPEFGRFCREIEQIYQTTRENRGGQPADYIPQLNLAEPAVDQYAVAFGRIIR